MNTQECQTITVQIFIAGDYEQIKQVCREYCVTGFCVSIQKTDYVYQYGEEAGAVITLINYPRFPSSYDGLINNAVDLGWLLADGCCQRSFTIQAPNMTTRYTRKGTA